MITEKDENQIPEEQIAEEVVEFSTWRTVLKTLLICSPFIIISLLIPQFVIMLSYIPSGSMENTIMTGDILFATRYNRTDIQRYDIMIFFPPDEPDVTYIKRVIGLPGETITVSSGEVYAGAELLDSSFLPEEMTRTGDGVYMVPEGCYFMLGDNRNHSLDARFWKQKYVPLENMVAKAETIIFPFNRIGSLRYQGPEGERTAAVSADSTPEVSAADGEVRHIHSWVTAEESSGTSLVLYCQSCGEQKYLELLQINEPEDGCAQHRIAITETGHMQEGENGLEWVEDNMFLSCADCDWSAEAVPAG